MGFWEDIGADKWFKGNPVVKWYGDNQKQDFMNRLEKSKPDPKPYLIQRPGFTDPQARRDLVTDIYTKQGRPNPYAQGPPQRSATDEIFERLQQLQDPSRYMSNDSDLSSQAAMMASAQYDPIISALQNQMSQAQNTAEQHKGQLGQMYESLSQSYTNDLPRIQQGYEAADQGTDQAFDQLRNQITEQYQTSQNQQAELMNKLNIQAAAPGILPNQQRDQDYFTNLANTNEQTAQTALDMEQRGAEEFTRQGSQIAKFEGTNKQATLMEQLRALLGQYQGQIGQQTAAKQAAISSNMMKLRGDNATSASQRAQQEFDNYVTSIRLGKELNTQKEIGPVKSPADVPARAMSFGLDEQQAQRVQNVFNSALDSDEMIQEGINPTYGTPLTSAAKAARMRELGTQMGLSSSELNALRYLALEYFG